MHRGGRGVAAGAAERGEQRGTLARQVLLLRLGGDPAGVILGLHHGDAAAHAGVVGAAELGAEQPVLARLGRRGTTSR